MSTLDWIILIPLAVAGVAAVVADIRSADRALYHRIHKGGNP